MGSREQALIREFPNGETHLRYLGFQAQKHQAGIEATRSRSRTKPVGCTSERIGPDFLVLDF